MRRFAWLPVLVLVVVLYTASTGTAQSATEVNVRIERDPVARVAATDLGVNHIVTITDRATGKPPTTSYRALAQATNRAGEETKFFDCPHASDTDPRVPPGVFYCTVFVDHGGAWDLVVTINERRTTNATPNTVARASAPFDLVTNQVYTDSTKQVRTSAMAIILLQAHVLVAGAWFVCVAALTALALPRLRRRVSGFGLYRLERRFDDLVWVTRAVTMGLIGTGVYLLAKETAYTMPTSSSALRDVLTLPYAQPYFFALGIKLAIYSLMVVSVGPLVRGARRHLESSVGGGSVRRTPAKSVSRTSAPFAVQSGALVTALVEAPPVDEPAREEVNLSLSFPARVAVATLAVGTFGISLCITLLKYFHQVIEAGR